MQKIYLIIGIAFALLANILGAFGTHSLQKTLTIHQLEIFKTGIEYQFNHSLGLLILAILMFHIKNRWIVAGGISFIIGIILFSGSLYALSLTTITTLGLITPLGGLAFIFGWVLLGIGIINHR